MMTSKAETDRLFSKTDSNETLGPLPQQRLLPQPDLSGRIKLRTEDFLVEELPLYQPSGRGEHLYLFIQKEGIAHSEMIKHLRQHFRVHDRDIGFAGMKDRSAVTRQLVSVHLP
jgi:tRNA pseudouridine13 synthase